jgi:hypothetical protein
MSLLNPGEVGAKAVAVTTFSVYNDLEEPLSFDK